MDPVESILVWIGNVEVLSYLLPLGLFLSFYFFGSPWRDSELGKALMYQKASFTLVVLVILGSVFFPGYFGRGAVRIVVYGIVLISLWIDFGNLLRYQKVGRMSPERQQKFLDENTRPKKL